MAAIIPIIMGGRVLQVAAPRALALIEAGVARYLPSMRTVGSQSAGPNAAGSFYRSAGPNLPAMADRPGLIGKGLAGGAGLGAMAMDRPEAVVPPEGRVPIPPGLFGELDMRGARATEPAPTPAPAPAPVRSTGEAFGPPMYTNTDMSARFSDPPQQYVSSDMSARFLDPAQTERRAVQVARDVVRPAAPAPVSPRPTNEGFLGRLFGGPEYQSTGQRLIENGRVNWGDPESAADFVRADRADMAMRAGRAEGGGIPEGMMGARPMPMPNLDMPAMDKPAPMGNMPPLGAMGPSGKPTAGAGAGGRDAAINKALEIIHHLVIRGR